MAGLSERQQEKREGLKGKAFPSSEEHPPSFYGGRHKPARGPTEGKGPRLCP